MVPAWRELPGQVEGDRLEIIIANSLSRRASEDWVDVLRDQDFEVLGGGGVNGLGILMAREIIRLLPSLQKPMAISDFVQAREGYLRAAYTNYDRRVRKEKKSLTYEWYPGHLQDFFRLSLLDASGLLMKKELDEVTLEREKPGEKSRQRVMKTAEGLFRPRISDRLSEDKQIGSVEEAADLIEKFRIDGLRVVMTMGAFDGPLAGHLNLFDEIGGMVGVHGKVFAFLASDEELQISKSHPQICTLDERLGAVSRVAAVDYVCPIGLPEGTKSVEGLDRYYTDLHRLLLPHWRVVGERDRRFEHFAKECAEANIGLLVSDRPRLTSTTDVVARLSG